MNISISALINRLVKSFPLNSKPNNVAQGQRSPLLAALLFVLLFQGVARYAAAPITGLVLDDWSNWYHAEAFSSLHEGCKQALRHPMRPVTILATVLGFRILGDNVVAYTLLSLVSYSVVLSLCFFIVYALTRSVYQSTLFGLLFSVLPNLSEHFHWPTVVVAAGACALPLYLGSALAWILFIQRGKLWHFLLSVICYGLGLFGYEIGAFLPLAYAVLLAGKKWRTRLFILAVFGLVMGIYTFWRITDAFGVGFSWYGTPSQMRVDMSPSAILWNARDIVEWWVGANMNSAFIGGLNGFGLVAHRALRWIVLGDIALLAAACLLLWSRSRVESRTARTFSELPIRTFAVVWVAVAYAPCLISYTSSRLNYLPAIGVVFLVSCVLVRVSVSKWMAGFCIVAFLCMLSTQGTACNWRESALLNRNLYDRIAREKAGWKTRKMILFDTWQLAQRLTTGLTRATGHDISVVSHYNNAGLLRGFAPAWMVRRLSAPNSCPATIFDVEYGARLEGERLIWHDRYDPSKPHTNAVADVFIIDCLNVMLRPVNK